MNPIDLEEKKESQIDLENKEPMIVEQGHRPSMNINIHCNRCNELKLALQIIGISMGVTSLVLVLWLIDKK